MNNYNDPLANIAREINEGLRGHFCPHMRIGATIDHPNGYKVLVTDGRYLDATYGHVTNWWTWRRVNDDGTLGTEESGYGW